MVTPEIQEPSGEETAVLENQDLVVGYSPKRPFLPARKPVWCVGYHGIEHIFSLALEHGVVARTMVAADG